MARNLTEQIIAGHLVSGSMEPGQTIAIEIEHTLLTDTTGPMAMLQFEAMGVERVRTRRSVVFADHNTLQLGFENMDDHHYLASACARYGLYFSRPGNGICHQVNLERFSTPGDTLLGGDSHTTTAGGVGMLAIGAGGLDVAAAMAGQPFYLAMPQVLGIHLTGQLRPGCAAKDVCLEILKRLTVSGGRGKILEFHGPGVETLSVPERATLTNMSIETGAFTAIFPSDAVTRRFFEIQQRLHEWQELPIPAKASYDETMNIDLDDIEPMVAMPHSPDNVVKVSEKAGLKMDQVGIGSCTNSSLADMLRVAEALKGKHIPQDLSLIIAPGSRQVLMELARCGALAHMIAAGARIMETACGFCVGVGQAPCSNGVSLRTINRNFTGRSGTKDGQVYLVSAETAVASALAGCLSDPSVLGQDWQFEFPDSLEIDDSMISAPPPADGHMPEVLRGPNIKPLPAFLPLPDELEGPVLLKLGDNVSTDDILPAGAQILSLRSNVPKISEYVFHRMEPDYFRQAQEAGTSFIAASENYGQGSAREHAALCPRYLGVRAVLALSFACIHRANLINFGILPLELAGSEELGKLQAGDRISIKGLQKAMQSAAAPEAINLRTKEAIMVKVELSPRQAEILLAGGMLPYIQASS
ncbi:MAG: aconitate hydratase [Desulfarculaceae bacterium]|jgi:aconitate hydratase